MTAKTLLVGVRFERPPTAKQAVLDRYVFALMKRRAAAKRPLGQTPPGSERRMAPRVEIGPNDKLEVVLLPARPLGALSRLKAAEEKGTPLDLFDISTTGCCLVCPDPAPMNRGDLIRLQLTGEDLDLELQAKVMNIGE
jgi:hypothetical protein